jgi:hypothetical protein
VQFHDVNPLPVRLSKIHKVHPELGRTKSDTAENFPKIEPKPTCSFRLGIRDLWRYGFPKVRFNGE